MRICGLQKLSLLDYPEKLAATVFTGGCNLRCPFCHNALLVTGEAETLPTDEVLAFLKTRRGLLDGVCLTGGEPLLQDDLRELVIRIRDLGFAVKLDTNGTFPERLDSLLRDGLLDYVAMDIKNSLPKYPATVGLPRFPTAPVEESVRILRQGTVPYEFRTTLVREFHTEDDLLSIVSWLEGSPRYYLQTFVDSGGLILPGLHGFSPEEMQHFAEIARPYFGIAEVRG